MSGGKFIHHLLEVNLHVILLRCHIDVSFVIDTEEVDSPALDVIGLLGIFNGPFLQIDSCFSLV